MTANKTPEPAASQSQAANNGVAVELSSEAISNLTGFFDVLIQMDFALKERNKEKSDDNQRSTDYASKVD